MDELGVWEPLDPIGGMALLSELPAPWWVGGGWAIDLFHGAQTRSHGDFDVEMLRRDQLMVQRFLGKWDIHIANDGKLQPWQLDTPLPEDANGVWCRPEPHAPWQLQIMFAPTRSDTWLYRRDTQVTRPVAELGYQTPEGIPTLYPEIQLLYKSTRPHMAKNVHDFQLIQHALTDEQRTWLTDALKRVSPDHPWLGSLLA